MHERALVLAALPRRLEGRPWPSRTPTAEARGRRRSALSTRAGIGSESFDGIAIGGASMAAQGDLRRLGSALRHAGSTRRRSGHASSARSPVAAVARPATAGGRARRSDDVARAAGARGPPRGRTPGVHRRCTTATARARRTPQRPPPAPVAQEVLGELLELRVEQSGPPPASRSPMLSELLESVVRGRGSRRGRSSRWTRVPRPRARARRAARAPEAPAIQGERPQAATSSTAGAVIASAFASAHGEPLRVTYKQRQQRDRQEQQRCQSAPPQQPDHATDGGAAASTDQHDVSSRAIDARPTAPTAGGSRRTARCRRPAPTRSGRSRLPNSASVVTTWPVTST